MHRPFIPPVVKTREQAHDRISDYLDRKRFGDKRQKPQWWTWPVRAGLYSVKLLNYICTRYITKGKVPVRLQRAANVNGAEGRASLKVRATGKRSIRISTLQTSVALISFYGNDTVTCSLSQPSQDVNVFSFAHLDLKQRPHWSYYSPIAFQHLTPLDLLLFAQSQPIFASIHQAHATRSPVIHAFPGFRVPRHLPSPLI